MGRLKLGVLFIFLIFESVKLDTPVIGVIATRLTDVEFEECKFSRNSTSFIESINIRWIEAGGAKVVPIFINQPESYYENMFKVINGLVFPGVDQSLTTSPYSRSVRILYKLAVEANNKGDYFPIWGACLGFQFLFVLAANTTNVRERCDARDFYFTNLKFVPEAQNTSRLIQSLSPDVKGYLEDESQRVTIHNHYFCITDNLLHKYQLEDDFLILSYCIDRVGRSFVSTVESKKYPFYGTGWHPEGNYVGIEFREHINHPSEHESNIGLELAEFFVSEARKNKHSFDVKSLKRFLIHSVGARTKCFIKNYAYEIYEMQ